MEPIAMESGGPTQFGHIADPGGGLGIGGLTLRDKAAPLAEAHAGHEAASHRLHHANTGSMRPG